MREGVKEGGSDGGEEERKEGETVIGERRSDSKGLTLTQMPQPMQSGSDIDAILSTGVTSMQSLPARARNTAGA